MPNDPLRATHSIISKPLSSTSQPHPFQTGTTTTLLSQSNSFHTFQQPTINLSSYTFAKPIQSSSSSSSSATTNRQLNSSRSSNCLSDGLIEDEEFIDKLFPKCRPKAKISNVNHHHNNNNTSIGNKSGNNNVAINSYDHNIVDSLPSNKMHSPQPPPSPTPPPAPTLAPSSSITNEQSNLNEIDQQQQQHRTGSKTRKVSSSSSTSTSGNIPQSHLTPLGLQSRRLWNFMDISPSPSPPPLSPIEMTSTQTDSLYDAIINYNNNNNNNERISPTVGETVNYPQPTRRDSLHNKTSNNNNNNNRYDINSYELNRSTTTTTGNVNIEETKTNDEWDSSNDDCLLNESATINNMNRTIKSKQMGAHYRLDSLLSHSEENPLSTSMGNHNKPKSTMINGIKKSNRISLEPIVSNIFTDLNDDDDVLFSRIGPDNNINKSTKMKYLNEDPNNDDGDEDTEEEVAIGIRNRIEMAGGRELFSSSRGTRSKRRSNSTNNNNNNNNNSNNNNNFKYNSGINEGSQLSNCNQRRSSSSSGSINSRHTLLYSVSMATNVDDNNVDDDDDDEGGVGGGGGGGNDLMPPTPAPTSTTMVDNVSNEKPSSTIINERERFKPIQTFDDEINVRQQQTMPTPSSTILTPSTTNETITKMKQIEEIIPLQNELDHRGSCEQFARDLKKRLDIWSDEERLIEANSNMKESSREDVEHFKKEIESECESISNEPETFVVNERIARVIGSVPIAQYEGSPKRYGPKPGYPKRVLSLSSNSVNQEYDGILDLKPSIESNESYDHHHHLIQLKTNNFSSENGSPHSSTSSQSSATYSSTDMHSSSSFSCPSNQQQGQPIQQHQQQQQIKSSNGFTTISNRNETATIVSCDDIVKSILSIPNNGQIDTEDDDNVNHCDVDDDNVEDDDDDEEVDEDVRSFNSDKPIELIDTSMIRTNEPIYSADPNKSSGYSSKRSLHSDDSESVTKSRMSCDCTTKIVGQQPPPVQVPQPQIPPQPAKRGSIQKSNGKCNQTNIEHSQPNEMKRNVPKTLLLDQYQQSFESTDSSYRSESIGNTKMVDYYYGQSDEDGTNSSSYLFKNSYPLRSIHINGTNRNENSIHKSNDNDRPIEQTRIVTSPPTIANQPTNFNCLSPELTMTNPHPNHQHHHYNHLNHNANVNSNNHHHTNNYDLQTKTSQLQTIDMKFDQSSYPSDQCESYSDNEKPLTDGTQIEIGTHRINTMPCLEDGLSSGMPSSDEIDYDDDVVGGGERRDHPNQSTVTQSHENDDAAVEADDDDDDDLDEYVNEYNNTTNNGPRSVNGSQQFNNYYYKNEQQRKVLDNGGQTIMYRSCSSVKTNGANYDEHDSSSQTHHHQQQLQLNHHLHNHPFDESGGGSRVNQSTIPYENGKPGSAEKYLIPSSSTQLRSVSNSSSSNNSNSLSTVRNVSGQIIGSKPILNSSPSPGHYHHYYHPSVPNRQQYPNLSSSPTSMSPNSNTMATILHQSSTHHSSHSHNHQSSASSSTSSGSNHGRHSYQTGVQNPQSPTQTIQSQQELIANVVNASAAAAAASTMSSSSSSTMAPANNTTTNNTNNNTTNSPSNVRHHHDEDCDTDQETDRLLGSQRNNNINNSANNNEDQSYYEQKAQLKRSSTSREVLIEGVLFRARYLGSTQLVCDGQPTKATRMMQAEEAVSRIKSLAPEGETQPSTEVDLFISTEKIMVLNTDLKEIMMDHALRTISYIADIGDLLVLMARRRTPIDDPTESGIKRIPKMICHVFESEEAQFIAQSIGQAFQVAYMEFLKANGIEDSSFLKEMDYQEVLNSQEIFGNELEMFAKREKQKEVIVPKQKGEILGIVIVESGWGSMLPTVVIANMAQSSPSARCGQLNIGDQIIAINGISLVGLPLSTCQAYVKNTKNQTAVKFTIVPCAPVVEVKIKRPDTKYQLGFSVQNGVICSLLRGGIAERGGVRVGHRIIEINGQSVVAVPHDRIVNLLATSVGEIAMKTMPTSMYRLLTGQDSPTFM